MKKEDIIRDKYREALVEVLNFFKRASGSEDYASWEVVDIIQKKITNLDKTYFNVGEPKYKVGDVVKATIQVHPSIPVDSNGTVTEVNYDADNKTYSYYVSFNCQGSTQRILAFNPEKYLEKV